MNPNVSLLDFIYYSFTGRDIRAVSPEARTLTIFQTVVFLGFAGVFFSVATGWARHPGREASEKS